MARRLIQMRISEAGVVHLDALAEKFDLTRSEVIRAALVMAFTNPEQFEKRLADMQQAEAGV